MRAEASPKSGLALWGGGFRPFFLAAALYASVLVPGWVAIWLAVVPAPAWLWPSAWHAHEMLFGVVAAAIAGFLTTSVPVWTSTRALAGAPLAALFAIWLAGRVAMVFAGRVSAGFVAAIDLAFLPALALVLARALVPARQPRNLGFLPVLAALWLCNAAVHAQALGFAWPASQALRLAVDLVVVLIVVIGGRITPAFTRNALAREGVDAPVRSRPWLDRAAIAAAVALAVADLLAPRTRVSGVVAGIAAVALAGRMLRLADAPHGPRSAALVAACGARVGRGRLRAGRRLRPRGCAALAGRASRALRGRDGSDAARGHDAVALGHTGRALVLPRGAVICYVLVHLGALLRVTATAMPASPPALLVAAGVSWAGAFALYAALYAPILCAPRVDGRPG